MIHKDSDELRYDGIFNLSLEEKQLLIECEKTWADMKSYKISYKDYLILKAKQIKNERQHVYKKFTT